MGFNSKTKILITAGLTLMSIMIIKAELSEVYSILVDTTYATPPSSNLVQKLGYSALECARMCSEVQCLTFNFVESNKTCLLSDGVIPEASRTIFISERGLPHCPSYSGYTVYKNGDVILCLRTVKTLVHQPTAESDCVSDGGHLALVENEKTRLLVKDVLTMKTIGAAWIDGKDYYGNKTYKNWKGEVMTYLPFRAPDPAGADEQCLVVTEGSDYEFRDGQCDRSYWYICQII